MPRMLALGASKRKVFRGQAWTKTGRVGTVCARDQREADLAGVEVWGWRPSRRES